ncbi:LOW QUALITY PROTEIN: hypothetical protein Cgig2_013606 [Carnegiea gigantea]|uniref:Uncharacterized protein n=1 Tax=Carnegiea gigantea TaxID=171969 RepID=A0A9Q1KCR1_9CARY|nr:LOW QUALITY PROTEIN: hypothetical protein Cgig2_013606 [Carnegiea gigantea]
MRQPVTYEWKPILCQHCKMYGHAEDQCRKKSVKKVWRAVAQPPATTEASSQVPNQGVQADEDGFIPEDRLGGNEIQDHEIHQYSEYIHNYSLQELRSMGPYFTWTNKTIWSRINRAFVNAYWVGKFDYSQVDYLANILSDHTAMVVETTNCPKPKKTFQFCDMHRDFIPLIKASLPGSIHPLWCQLQVFLQRVQKALSKLNKDHFSDLRGQYKLAREELEKTQLALLENPTSQDLL